MPPLHRKVLEIVESNKEEDGIHVAEVARAVHGTSAEDIMWVDCKVSGSVADGLPRDTVEQLMSDGHLYSTIDDEVCLVRCN